jgi:hypothetical protein
VPFNIFCECQQRSIRAEAGGELDADREPSAGDRDRQAYCGKTGDVNPPSENGVIARTCPTVCDTVRIRRLGRPWQSRGGGRQYEVCAREQFGAAPPESGNALQRIYVVRARELLTVLVHCPNRGSS